MNRIAFLALAVAFTLPASAQESLDQLAGTWKRNGVDGGEPSFYRLDVVGGALEGPLLNPPEGLACTVRLERSGDKLVGTANWVDKEFAGFELSTRWELSLAGGSMAGRCEWKAWEPDGSVSSSGWDSHKFDRLARLGLATAGEAEEPFGDPIEDLAGLKGVWSGPGGAWRAEPGNGFLSLEPIGDHHANVKVALRAERGILKGLAHMPEGVSCPVEVALEAEKGQLSGRSGWFETNPDGSHANEVGGWSPVRFVRARRVGVAGEEAVDAPAPGSSEPLDGVWRTRDGLYLRLRAGQDGPAGELTDREGEVKARLTSLRDSGGVWTATLNFGGDEVTWELSQDGSRLSGRSQWRDLLDGKVVDSGWSALELTRLQRLD